MLGSFDKEITKGAAFISTRGGNNSVRTLEEVLPLCKRTLQFTNKADILHYHQGKHFMKLESKGLKKFANAPNAVLAQKAAVQ